LENIELSMKLMTKRKRVIFSWKKHPFEDKLPDKKYSSPQDLISGLTGGIGSK
jgi:hypothetical protein